MASNRTEIVTVDMVKTEFEEISEDDDDIDLNLTHCISMDWKLNPNVECRVPLQKLNIPSSGNDNHNLRTTEMNVQSVRRYDADRYSKFRLLVDELSNFVDKCEEKCGHCEEYILLLQNHVIQSHVRSHTANRSQERVNPSNSSKNSNLASEIPNNEVEVTSSPNVIPNNEGEEEVESRMGEMSSGNQDVESVRSRSLINSELVTLEHENYFSTITANLKQEPDYSLCHEDPLLDIPSDLHLQHELHFSGNVDDSSEGQLTSETELIVIHSKDSVGSTASTSFTRSGTNPKPFYCSTCGNYFTTNGSLTRHKLIHTEGPRFNCDVCGKCYTDSANLIIHQRTHTGMTPFECFTCGKCFTNRNYWTIHNKIHTGEFRFNCDVCGKSLSSRHYLITHQRTHTGEKPFKCELCGQRFSTNGSLTRHKLVHTGSKPFKCDVCGLFFALSFNLKKHKKRTNH